MKIEKISPKTIRQQVYDQLRRKIISAEILPGQVMTLQGLATEFGVSMMPVREALWQLESEKVIVIDANKSICVSALSAKDMKEALEIRMILESRAAEKACNRITHDELAKLKQLLDGMEASYDKPKRFMLLNSQFHFTIYSCADSPMLLGIIDSLWARIGPYLNIGWAKAGDHSFTLNCHREMYEALIHKDKKRLKKWLCGDLREAAGAIIPNLENSISQTKENI